MPGAGGQSTPRTTFRPPWVKDGPNPLPMPTAPWTLNRRDSNQKTDDAPAFTKVTLKSVSKPEEAKPPADQPRKQSKITIIPSQVNSSDNKKNTGQPPALSKARENGRPEPASRPQLERQVRVDRSRSRGDVLPISKSESTTGAPTLSKSSSRAAIPPPPPPRPPPPPPSRNILKDLAPLSEKQQKTIEMLKSRPRKRPDWACMMKEVESGKKLRHVKCNDRSAPLIERVDKVITDPKGPVHFIYESEKSNVHNQLLHQIQRGVALKSVKTNDRSRPNLEGLRKFRRQLTIEEQIKKADEPVEAILPDEMDDIDAVRDDLQSTKQMLALELRNKEALERDNKRLQKTNLTPETSKLQSLQFKLQARILNLEAELEHEKSQKSIQEYKKQDTKLSESLKKEAEQARKDAERLEKDYATVSEERDKTKNELEDMKRMYATLERRMKAGMALAGCPSAKDVARIASQKSIDKSNKSNASESEEETEEESEEEESSEEESDEEEDPKAAEEKRLQRELKLLQTKIKSFKDKSDNARKERHALREQIKQQNKLLKEEKKKFKRLQKEVDKMAKLMGDAEDEEHEDEEEEEEEEEEETESEDESESEESEEDEADDANAPLAKQKNNLQLQTKRYEGRLAALKKGNYLLKAQVDRLKDDLAKQREESLSLQEDLDSVLAELG